MKRLFVLLVSVLIASPAMAQNIRQNNQASTGYERKIIDAVVNGEASAALANGDVACWKSSSHGTDGNYTVVKCTTLGQHAFACVVTEAIAAGETGKCQFGGYHGAIKAQWVDGNPIAVGEPLVTSGDDGYATGAIGDIVVATGSEFGISQGLYADEATTGTIEGIIWSR